MKCFMCKGSLEEKSTNFIADMGTCIIIVKDVPSQVCTQCGEVSYSNEVTEQLERIVNKMKDAMTEIAVVHYSDKVAQKTDEGKLIDNLPFFDEKNHFKFFVSSY